eukprot:s507_g26.t1
MMSPVASNYALRLCLRIHNFGGEEYAYLTHITHFYDDLAPITIFTLGSIYDSGWHWLKCRKLNFVLSYLDRPEKRQSFPGFATMAHQKPDSFMEFEGRPAGALGKWFETFIYNVSLKKARHTGVLYNPIFAVSRERIRQYPKSMYERLLREILRCTSKAHEGVAEAGHYLERAWKPMFESDMPDAIKCSGHFGQKKGDEVCCNQSTPSKPVRIELPWTICALAMTASGSAADVVSSDDKKQEACISRQKSYSACGQRFTIMALKEVLAKVKARRDSKKRVQDESQQKAWHLFKRGMEFDHVDEVELKGAMRGGDFACGLVDPRGDLTGSSFGSSGIAEKPPAASTLPATCDPPHLPGSSQPVQRSMVDDNPNDITTSKGQYLWRQRIAKERAHFSPNKRENFSVRSALRVLDVPSKFKPGHIDPHEKGQVQGLDAATERSLRADVAAKSRAPNEQLMWPETEQHQVGWHARASGPGGLPYEERGTMSGLAPRLGLGWRGEKTAGDHAKASGSVQNPRSFDVISARKDDLISKWLGTRRHLHSGLDAAATAAVPATTGTEGPAGAPEVAVGRSPREIQERWLQLQQNWEHQKRQRRERRRQKFASRKPPAANADAAEPAETATAVATAVVRKVDFSLDKSNIFAPAACAGLRSALPQGSSEDAWKGVGVVPRPDSQQELMMKGRGSEIIKNFDQDFRQVAQAAERNRNFMNRPGNPWFKPKGSSDVVAFGNAYAKSFGYSIFSKASVPGMAGAPAAPAPAAPGHEAGVSQS